MVTIKDLQPKVLMTEEDYIRLISKGVMKDDPQYATRQVAHHRNLGRIWYEKAVESREGGYRLKTLAEQAASQRCYWRARLYAGLED
jgi:hypothetical protein